LLQREVRQLVESDEQKLRALIAVNVVFVAAIAKARRRAVGPSHDVLGLVVFLVVTAGHVSPEVREQRGFQFRVRAPQQKRVCPWPKPRLKNRFPKQRLGFSGACSSAKEPVLCGTVVENLLTRKRPIMIAEGHLTIYL